MPRPPPRHDDPESFAQVFLNSYDPLGEPVDRLADGAAVRAFLPGWLALPRDSDWAALAADLRPWRDGLRKAVRAAAEGRPAALDRLLRRELAGFAFQARPGAAGLVFRPDPAQSPAALVKALALQGLAAELAAAGPQRLRLCQAPPCEELFFDRSKRGAQHFCGKRCANRVHVARFRERHRRT